MTKRRASIKETLKRKPVALALVGALGIAGYGVYRQEQQSNRNDQATLIQDALNGTITSSKLSIRCVKEVQPGLYTKLDEGEKLFGRTHKGSTPNYDVQLDEVVCRGFEKYVESKDMSSSTDEMRFGLLVAVHEGVHVRDNISMGEAETQCIALQEMPGFLRYVGAATKEARSVQRDMMNTYLYDFPERYITEECYDGGPLDIHPAQQNQFPFDAPK